MRDYCFVVGVKHGRIVKFISTLDAEGILFDPSPEFAIKWDSEEAAHHFIRLLACYLTDSDYSVLDFCVKVYSCI